MKLRLFACLALVLLCAAGACDPRGRIEAAQRAADEFHRRYSAQQYAEIYQNTTSVFRNSASQQDFENYEKDVQAKLGTIKSTDLNNYSVLYLFTGPMVRLDYQTTFAKGHAAESFEVRFKDGKPVIESYRIDNPLLH